MDHRLSLRLNWLFGLLLMTGLASGQSGEAPLPSTQLLPLEADRAEFLITDGDGEGRRVPLTLRRAEDGRGDWVMDFEGYNRLHLRQAEDGGIEITRVDLPERGQAIVYEQPVPLLPARVEPNGGREFRTPAGIVDLDSGEITRQGTAVHSVSPLGRTRFSLPAGTLSGYLLTMNQTVTLDNAELRITIEAGFAPGNGLVYRHLRYTIDKPLFFGSTTSRTAELADPTPTG